MQVMKCTAHKKRELVAKNPLSHRGFTLLCPLAARRILPLTGASSSILPEAQTHGAVYFQRWSGAREIAANNLDHRLLNRCRKA